MIKLVFTYVDTLNHNTKAPLVIKFSLKNVHVKQNATKGKKNQLYIPPKDDMLCPVAKSLDLPNKCTYR